MKKQILFVLVLVCSMARSQELPQISPKSPEATEFIKHGNTSVSMYTGKPNISIPVYTVQGREFSLPISLSYDAGGIQVNQIATQVGLAWSLQAGGMVTRVTNGKPDHILGNASSYYDSYYTQFEKLDAFYKTTPPRRVPYDLEEEFADAYLYTPEIPGQLPTLLDYFLLEEEIHKGLIDTQPDYFSFNVGGISGDIYIDPETGEARCSNGKDYKISYTGSLTDFKAGGILSWHITDEHGNQYFFDRYDTTETFIDVSGENDIKKFISSWQLTKIISANKKDILDFRYNYANFWTNEKYVPRALSSISTLVRYSLNGVQCENDVSGYNANSSSYKIAQHYLSSIRLNDQEVISFIQSTTERKDVSSRYALEKISIANGIDWSFHQSYFKSSPDIDLNAITTITQDDIRLKLDSITKGPRLNTALIQTYRFDYHNPDAVPNLQSFSQDYWGFYNGKSNTSIYGLIPKKTVLVTTTINTQENTELRNLPGADRTPNLNYSKNGTLYRITYPTGGATEFDYEQHGVYKEKEEVVFNDIELGRLIGGNDPSDPYNYYDDEYFYDNPKGAEFFVPIYEPGTKDIKIRYSAPQLPHGPGDNDDGVLFVAILKCNSTVIPVPPGSCGGPTSPSQINCPANLKWEDIINYPVDKRMLVKTYRGGPDVNSGALVDGYTEIIPVDLDAGYYKLYILNGVTNSGLTVTTRYPETRNITTTIPVGGLRVRSTQDFTGDSTTPVLTKRYDYTHTRYNACGDAIAVPSGKLHFNPIYSQHSYYDRITSEGTNGCEYIDRFSQPLNPRKFPHIAYSSVKEFHSNTQGDNNGYTAYHFYNKVSEFNKVEPYIPELKSDFKNGNIKELLIYDQENTLKQKTVHVYGQTQVENSIHGFKSSKGRYKIDRPLAIIERPTDGKQIFKLLVPIFIGNGVSYPYIPNPIKVFDPPTYTDDVGTNSLFTGRSNTSYLIASNYLHLDKTITTDYFENDSISNTTNYFYDNLTNFPNTNRQLTRTKTTSSNGNTIETHTYYPTDVVSVSSLGNTPLTTTELNTIDRLKKVKSDGTFGLHHVTTPVQVVTTVKNANGTMVSENIQRTHFKTWDNQLILPEEIQTAKGNTALENRIQYHKYDSSGNPLEVSKADGVHSSYIWGYQNMYPIAKIDNASYAEMPLDVLNLINTIRTASNTEDSLIDEDALRSQFASLRAHVFFKNALVSSYTYDPLIGVTSMTNPKGYTAYYEYDEQNRLKTVKDAEGNLLTENQYHYKNQN